ncbi:MAG: dTDP-4-dehydrorhamnose 3,5-epimerase [Lentisphaeria bacterium]|nr:dTDP-4-dehydrorhamnose 3,5-epimerase [Lentisphaeria bacterium]
MTCTETPLPGVLILEPRVFEDSRGLFFESHNARAFAQLGIDTVFVQDNHSVSSRNVVRGLHFQRAPHTQAKLVRVIVGEAWDVVVDLRMGSPTFRHWHGITLSAENRRMLYLPKGLAHGFCARTDTVEFLYKCDDFYASESAGGLRWNDPQIGIDWPVEEPVLSDQDRILPLLEDLPELFSYHNWRNVLRKRDCAT